MTRIVILLKTRMFKILVLDKKEGNIPLTIIGRTTTARFWKISKHGYLYYKEE